MLYTGNQQSYQHITADDAEQEQILRAEGWKDYGDLPASSPSMQHASGIGASAISPYDPTNNQPSILNKLEAAQAEIERLNAVIAAGMAENQQLRNQLRFKELEDTPADELKAMLDAASVKYKANDSKTVLAQAVLDLENSQAD